jgi:K+:H+ antiporter
LFSFVAGAMASLITTTVHNTVTKTLSASASPSSTLRATPQGGILEGSNPSVYDPKNPITIFIIQVNAQNFG